MRILKQTVGIDVASKQLDVSLGRMHETLETDVYAYKQFNNTPAGFTALALWVKKQTDGTVPVRFVMEATGVYHESLAKFLSEKLYTQSIVQPKKITNFFKTLEVKTVTDKSMSQTIALFGLEKTLDDWEPPSEVYRELRQLTRERDQLVVERTMNKNQLHAEEAQAYPNDRSVKRAKGRIKMINVQIAQIVAEIAAMIAKDKELAEAMSFVTSVPGIAMTSGATILAETDGFALIENKRQLTSLAGLDVKLKESGTSVRQKPQISKKGNRHLRKAMHMPALAAIRSNDRYRNVFARVVARSGIKMKGAVAVQRMLLEMAYTVFKTKTKYDPDYVIKKAMGQEIEIES